MKNPKRVAAGKMVSERTRLAREQQKKDAEAYRALGENKAKAATEPPEPAPTTEGESPKSSGKKIAALAPPNGLLLPA